MALLSRENLVYCFEHKLHGSIDRNTEHIFYSFQLDGKIVAQTHISPITKYRDFGDDILHRIARELGIQSGKLKKSASCDKDATDEIVEQWRTRLRS